MASTLEKVTPESNDKEKSGGRINKASCPKSDAEFKKLFGLTKDVRVCLTRIPDLLGSGEGFDSFSNLMKSDTNKEKEFAKMKEEKKQQSFNKKRKVKTFKKTMGYTKKRKIECTLNTSVNEGTKVSNSQSISTVLPASSVSHHNLTTCCNKTTKEEKRTETEHCIHENQEKVSLNTNAAFEESHSFNVNYTEDIFSMIPPQLEETARDEKIRRLKQALKEKEAALEEMRKKMHQK